MNQILSKPAVRRSLILAVVTALAVAATLVPVSARTREVKGEFRSSRVTPCSPTPICTEGRATGDIEGRFTLTGTSLIPTAETPSTGVIAYTAQVQIQTREGSFTCTDTGVTKTTGEGAASSICVLTGGTGIFQGATGYIQFQSQLNARGNFVGTYQGRLSGLQGDPSES
ncbi:MAG TPA: hypothetical protein VHJ78_12540 [Actinomycetota bacterium]|nr:hypothetical protein [Actinomycetota bacterium]